MVKPLPYCFQLEATRGPHTGSTYCYCSLSFIKAFTVHHLSIGRKKCCWLRLPKDLEVSSIHAEFHLVTAVENDTKLVFCDAKSTNGTKVNGKLLKAQVNYPLRNGDLITMGRTSLRFVHVRHGQPCGENRIDSVASASMIPTHSASSFSLSLLEAQMVVDLDKKEGENRAALALHSSTSRAFSRTTGIASTDSIIINTAADNSAANPDCGELKPVKDVVVISGGICTSTKEEHDNVKGRTTEIFGGKIGEIVDDCTPEEATCDTCSALIGRLDLLERQAHFNECIGGRAVTTAANVAVPLKGPVNSNDVGTKTRKRSNAGSGVTRATKLCKTKAGDIGDDSTEAAPKAKKPRKQRRADNGEDLMLALTGSSTMGKEQQTDLQLAMTNKKIVELDEKMAKMAKQRINLVKTLSRLEKTKEKLQKSQVLPPAKVLQFLDRETAFSVIFPSNRQAHVFDQCVNKKKMERSSAVATRYAPSRWSTFDHSVDYGKEKHAELAAVAAISMWKRASQQLFGLQRDLLLYRNSVLRTFVADDEDAGSSVNMENGCNLDNKDTDAMSKCEEEYDGNSKLTCVPSDIVLERIQNYLEVPDVVKRVFPNWHRDLTFLRSQSAKEIKLALEAMENAQAGANVLMVTNKEIDNKEGCREGTRSDHFITSCYALLDREEERLACNFMAQVMTQLIAEKSKDLNVKEVELKQVTTSSVDSRKGNCQERVRHCIVDVSESEIEEEPYIPACEELPKAVTAYCYD